MPGTEVTLGPFTKGLHNSAGSGENIDDAELFDLSNLEVDTDGSLVNRPAISTLIPTGFSGRFKIIGTFFPTGGAKYLVVSYGTGFSTTGLFDINANSIKVSRALKANVAVQYNNNLYIPPASDGTVATGGWYDNSATPAWTTVTYMPNGDDAVIFNDRMWLAAGINGGATNDSTVWYSCFLNPQTWKGDPNIPSNVTSNDAGFITAEQGNGQRAVSLLVMASDIIIFKEHSTFRFNYGTDPAKGIISKVSSTIGTPALKCAVSFDNNNAYVLHDTSVYELYNYTYTKLSTPISMTQVADSDLFSDANYGITLFRNRLFVRYYSKCYVFSLITGRWCKWVSNNKFITLWTVPGTAGVDTAYGASTSIANPVQFNTMLDDRLTNVGVTELFTCSITTKTYDFQLQWAFKVLFWWGTTISTCGLTNATVSAPNSSPNYSWLGLNDAFGSWANVNTNGIKWSNAPATLFMTQTPYERGNYSKKFLKFNKKIRFRQAYFTLSTPVVANSSFFDACVRIYQLSAFILQKQTVVARTT